MPAGKSIELTFTQDRETKNTKRFAEDQDGDERPTVGNVYVLNSALEEIGNPDRIKVVITPVK